MVSHRAAALIDLFMDFRCTWIEGSRAFSVVFGAATAAACLSVAVPTLWWVLPKSRVWLFSEAIDRTQGIQIAYGVFCMAMACTDALCRAIPHGHLPWVHPAFFLTTLLIVFGLGPRVAYVARRLARRRGPTRSGQRLASISLVALLAAVAAIPLAALWHAFGPHPPYAPDFTLTDQDGRPFTLSAERGHPIALFFGYTHCPDTCPTTLAHLARAMRSPRAPQDARVVFVTVDPQRDSPPVLKRYVALFDPRFVGLTGSTAALEPVYAAYHTWHESLPANKRTGDYEVAHGAAIYFIGRRGAVRGIGDWSDDVPTLITDLETDQ